MGGQGANKGALNVPASSQQGISKYTSYRKPEGSSFGSVYQSPSYQQPQQQQTFMDQQSRYNQFQNNIGGMFYNNITLPRQIAAEAAAAAAAKAAEEKRLQEEQALAPYTGNPMGDGY